MKPGIYDFSPGIYDFKHNHVVKHSSKLLKCSIEVVFTENSRLFFTKKFVVEIYWGVKTPLHLVRYDFPFGDNLEEAFAFASMLKLGVQF